MKYYEHYQNVTQRHKVSKCCWKNALTWVATNLQFVKKNATNCEAQQNSKRYAYIWIYIIWSSRKRTMFTYFPKTGLSSFKSSSDGAWFNSFLNRASGKGMLATLKLNRESPHRTPKKKYLFFSNLGCKEKKTKNQKPNVL